MASSTATIIHLPDQYINSNMSSYSGSYSDRYVYGNISSIPTFYSMGVSSPTLGLNYSNYAIPNVISGVVDFSRARIASTVDGPRQSLRNKTLWFSDYLNIVYGRYIPSRTSNFVSTHIDLSEKYYDSYVASPVQYFKANGRELTHNAFANASQADLAKRYQYMSGSRGSYTTSSIEDFSYPDLMTLAKRTKPTGSINISLLNSIGLGSDAITANSINMKWMEMYPFQSFYKNISYSSKNFLNVRYLSREEKMEVPFALSGSTSYYYPVTSSILGTIYCSYYGPSLMSLNNEASNASTLGSVDSNKYYNVILSDIVISGSEGATFAAFDQQIGSATSASYWDSFVPRRTTFRLEHQNNLFFGLGETKDMGKYLSPLSTSFVRNAIPFIAGEYKIHVSAPIIRGFKYGLINANPQSTVAIWRRDRFGQFRDMLEQRQFSKLYVNYASIPDLTVENQVATLSPIRVNFMSGSQAAITASNYQNWNPAVDLITTLSNSRDSGIYDYEYKSGQPFDDTL